MKKFAFALPELPGIVIGSMIKGFLAGVLIGYFSQKVRSLPLGASLLRPGHSTDLSRRSRSRLASGIRLTLSPAELALELFAGRRLSGAERRTLFRDQFFMLLLDEKQALASLPKLLPTQAEREAVMDMVRKVLSATGELSPARKDRLARVESILMEPAGAESRGRQA